MTDSQTLRVLPPSRFAFPKKINVTFVDVALGQDTFLSVFIPGCVLAEGGLVWMLGFKVQKSEWSFQKDGSHCGFFQAPGLVGMTGGSAWRTLGTEGSRVN